MRRTAPLVVRTLTACLLAAAWTARAQTAPADDFSPHLHGDLSLRYQNSGIDLPTADDKAYFGSLWYGGELKDQGLLNYNARLGVSGKLNDQLAYGARLMFRNHKQPAFSYPPFEPGFGNSYVVADLFYMAVTPVKGLSLVLGKQLNPLARIKTFFWDSDVAPTGATERYTLPLGERALGHDAKLTLVAGQWFPTPGLRNAPRTLVLVEQADYQASFGGPRGIELEAEAGFTKFNGFDRFLAAADTGGVTRTTVTTSPSGDVTAKDVPVLDYAKDNDARVTGFNPLWVDASVKVTLRALFGHPLLGQLGYVRNLQAGPPAGVAPLLPAPGLNAVYAGATYGKVKKRWDWSVGYAYEWKGAASMVSGWTDEVFGADLKGHVIKADLMPVQDLDVSFQWRLQKDADGLDRAGHPLPQAFADARYSDLRVALTLEF